MIEPAPPRKLEFEERVLEGRHTLLVRGELDLASVPDLDAAVDALCSAGIGDLCLDLTDLEFMDSAGLRSLLSAKEKCEQRGRAFSVITGPGAVQRVLDLTGASEVLLGREDSAAAGA